MFSLSPACNKQVKIGEFQIKALADIEIGKVTFVHINAMAHVEIVPDHFVEPAFIAGFKEQWHQYVADGVAGCACKAAGYIWHAIMDNAVFYKNGMLVGSDLACFETATAVDAYIDDDAAGTHATDHFFRNHDRASA